MAEVAPRRREPCPEGLADHADSWPRSGTFNILPRTCISIARTEWQHVSCDWMALLIKRLRSWQPCELHEAASGRPSTELDVPATSPLLETPAEMQSVPVVQTHDRNMLTRSAEELKSWRERCLSIVRHKPALSSADASCVTGNHTWLSVLIEAVDWQLRRWLGVSEYTQSSDCILRMQIVRNADYVLLKDGTYLRPGASIIDLHFWNQQIPPMPGTGPSLGWARRMNDSFRRSLQELAHHLASRTDVEDIAAVRAIAALGSDARGDKVSRILSRFGFEIVPQQQTQSATHLIRRYGENILISLMVLAYNAVSLRYDTLRRGRVRAYLSRRMLDDRYGAAAKMACPLSDLQQSEIYEVAQVRVG
jgi:hypothetical protein